MGTGVAQTRIRGTHAPADSPTHLPLTKCPDADVLDSTTLTTTLVVSKGEPTLSQAKTFPPPVAGVALLRFSASASKDRSCWAGPWRWKTNSTETNSIVFGSAFRRRVCRWRPSPARLPPANDRWPNESTGWSSRLYLTPLPVNANWRSRRGSVHRCPLRWSSDRWISTLVSFLSETTFRRGGRVVRCSLDP